MRSHTLEHTAESDVCPLYSLNLIALIQLCCAENIDFIGHHRLSYHDSHLNFKYCPMNLVRPILNLSVTGFTVQHKLGSNNDREVSLSF